MRNTILILSLCSLLFCDCSPNHEEIRIIKVQDISTSYLSEKVLIDSLSPHPVQIDYYKGYLIIRDTNVPDEEGMLQFYDLKNGTKTSCMLKGRGPGEMIGFYDFFVMEPQHDLFMLDVSLKKILYAPVDDLINGSIHPADITSIDLSKFPLFLTISGGSGKLFATGMMEDDRFISFDVTGANMKLGHYSPDMQKKEMSPMLNQAYMGRVVYEGSRQMLVVACRYADQLEYYDIRNSDVLFAKGPLAFEPSYVITKVQGYQVLGHNRDERIGYTTIDADKENIYVLYSGKTNEDPRAAYASELRVFGWNGNMRRRLELGHDLISIAVDDSGKNMYALSCDGKVLVYEL